MGFLKALEALGLEILLITIRKYTERYFIKTQVIDHVQYDCYLLLCCNLEKLFLTQ
jgi:hypothetical protein